jgi:hypothetical protein
MKRKTKKFNEGGKTYDKEDEGFFGNKINYREDSEGRKFVAGRPNPMDRNPQEQRYYSKDDVKSGLSNIGDKISNFFGGKKEDEPKKSTTMPSGYEKLDATEGNARTRKIEDYIKKSEPEEPAKPAGKTHVNESYKEEPENKPAKKVVAKKAAPASKASEKVGKDYEDVTRALRGSEKVGKGYEKLDPRSPEEKSGSGKNTFLTRERQEKADKAVYAGWKKKPVRSTADIRAGRQVEGMKKGGTVRKSASARADGCAIRGKTRA